MDYRGYVVDKMDRGFTPLDTSTPIMPHRNMIDPGTAPFDWTGEQEDGSDAWRFPKVEQSLLKEAQQRGRAVPIDMVPGAPPTMDMSTPGYDMSTIVGESPYGDLEDPSEAERMWSEMQSAAGRPLSSGRDTAHRVGDSGRTYNVRSPRGREAGTTYNMDDPGRTYNVVPPDATYNLGARDATYNMGPSDATYNLGPSDPTYNIRPSDATYGLGPSNETYGQHATYNVGSPGRTYNLGSPDATYNATSSSPRALGATYNLGSPMDQGYDESYAAEDTDPSLDGRLDALAASMAADRISPEVRIKVEEVVEGPMPHHTFVPSWVYMARKQYPAVFENAIDFYFTHMRWPKFQELPKWFIQVCWTSQTTPDKYERTSGFAPVWVYVLKMLCDEELLEKHWFTVCISSFFEDGAFPDMEAFPEELENHCAELGIDETNFYVKES